MPEPLTPIRPTRSPAPAATSPARATSVAESQARVVKVDHVACRGGHRESGRVRETRSRGGGSSAMRALAASIRFGLFICRPRRSQASSLRRRLSRRSAVTAEKTAALGSREDVPRSRPQDSTRPSTTSQVDVVTASRNHRSCVTTRRARSGRIHGLRWSASQATPDIEVVRRFIEDEKVGVGGERAQRRRVAARPGEGVDTGVEAADRLRLRFAEQTGGDLSDVRLAAHSCSSRAPWTASRGRSCPVGGSRPSHPGEAQRSGVGDPAAVEVTLLARTRRRVVLPLPLRTTTPIRSPVPTPSETVSRMARVPEVIVARSTLTRLAIRRRRVELGAGHRAEGGPDVADGSGGDEGHRKIDRRLAIPGEKGERGPIPTRCRQGALRQALLEHLGESRLGARGRRLEVVGERPTHPTTSPPAGRRVVRGLGAGWGQRRRPASPESVALGIHPRE